MFDIGGWEVLVIAVATIIVVGPKELPKMLRALGQFSAKMKTMAREFHSYIEAAAQETGIQENVINDVQNSISDIKNFSVTKQMQEITKPITDSISNIEQKNTKSENKEKIPQQKENINQKLPKK